MKKMVVFIACFLLLAMPTYAKEVIDLQDYSTCDSFGFCKTEVDINELTLSKDGKDFLKDVSSCEDVSCETSFDIEMSHPINNFRVEIKDKEKLIISGYITENTLWTADLGDVLLDPWWNYSVSGWSGNNVWESDEDSCGSAAGNQWFGLEIGIDNGLPVRLMTVRLYDTTVNTGWVGIFDSVTGSAIINTTDNASSVYTFNTTGGAYLEAGKVYHLITYSITRTSCTGNTPYAADDYNITAGLYCGTSAPETCTDLSGEIFAMGNITTQTYSTTAYTNYYETNLSLNGNASNITIDNQTELNMTANTNMTGLNVSLYLNGSYWNSGITNITNYTNLTTVYNYNITAYFFNASMNDTVTWWVNVTEYEAPPSNTTNMSYSICTASDTLYRRMAFISNETFTAYDFYDWCEFGCDNTTFSCNPPEYQQNVYMLGVIILFIIGMALVYNYGRRR